MGLTVTQAHSGRTAQGVRRPLASAGREGSRSSHHGGPPERQGGRLDHSVVPHIRLLFSCLTSESLDSACRGSPFSSENAHAATAAPSPARFCPCRNRPGSPFVPIGPIRSRPPAGDGLARELCPGMRTRRSCSFPLLALTRPMDSMLGTHRDHASGPHDLCNAVSVACDES